MNIFRGRGMGERACLASPRFVDGALEARAPSLLEDLWELHPLRESWLDSSEAASFCIPLRNAIGPVALPPKLAIAREIMRIYNSDGKPGW